MLQYYERLIPSELLEDLIYLTLFYQYEAPRASKAIKVAYGWFFTRRITKAR